MIGKAKGKRQKAKSKNPPLHQKRETRSPPRFPHGGNIHAFARMLNVEPEELLDFSASLNPLGMPSSARLVYRNALRKVEQYPEPYADALTQALSAYHGLDPACLLAGNGSTQLIYAIARAFHSRRVLLIAPLFSEHAAAFHASGAQVEHCILRPPTFSLKLESVEQLVRAAPYEALVLANPNSPTGALTPCEQMDELTRLCRQMHARLIVDETFIDWMEEESVKQWAAQDARILVLRSLTKFFALPGLRVGYAIASPRIIRQLRSHIEPWSVNVIAQEVGIACLRDRQFIERSRAFMTRERAWFWSRLSEIPTLRVFPSRANFFLLQLLRQDMTASDLASSLAQEKLLIRACDNFAGLGKRFFRVAVRKRAENRRLLDALRRLGLSRVCDHN